MCQCVSVCMYACPQMHTHMYVGAHIHTTVFVGTYTRMCGGMHVFDGVITSFLFSMNWGEERRTKEENM